jgi:hypothetical protein
MTVAELWILTGPVAAALIAVVRAVSPETWARLPTWAKPAPALAVAVFSALIFAASQTSDPGEGLRIALVALLETWIGALGTADAVRRFGGLDRGTNP